MAYARLLEKKKKGKREKICKVLVSELNSMEWKGVVCFCENDLNGFDA